MGKDFWAYGIHENMREIDGAHAVRPRAGPGRPQGRGRGAVPPVDVRDFQGVISERRLLRTRRCMVRRFGVSHAERQSGDRGRGRAGRRGDDACARQEGHSGHAAGAAARRRRGSARRHRASADRRNAGRTRAREGSLFRRRQSAACRRRCSISATARAASCSPCSTSTCSRARCHTRSWCNGSSTSWCTRRCRASRRAGSARCASPPS